MQHVDPYAVMRNTETLERYRAHMRATLATGRPFFALAAGMISLSGLFFLYRAAEHRPPVLVTGVLVSVSMAMAAALFITGAAKVAFYMHRHPFDPHGDA